MNELPEPTVAIPYPSLGVLRAAHAELLKRRRAEGEPPALWEEISRFISDGQISGAVLDNDAERETAQSLLDYWSTLLYQAGQPEIDATLHDFNLELAPELPNTPAPYVGLDAFRDGRFFFGRERLVEQMADKLADVRLLAVVGPSGSGKSSAVLAGLVPTLQRGALPGSEAWRILPRMVPGSHPLSNLARLLAAEFQPRINTDERGLEERMKAAPETLARLLTEVEPQMNADKRSLEGQTISVHPRSSVATPPTVLVVDQFEETFTLCTDEAERAAFAANLLGLAASPEIAHRVILTMRSDYESWVSRIPALQTAFDRGRVQAIPLSAEELRRAIVEPAGQVGLRYQAGIVESLISEVLGEPAALPLLQFTLRALWDERRRNRITWDVYQQVGGGRIALARAADRLYNSLMLEEQVTARRILLRLVQPGAGLEVTSSRVAVAELLAIGEDPGRVERVLERFLAARLLKPSEGDVAADRQVEVAHEALVRNWPTLVEWLDDKRENLRQRRRLTEAAMRWEQNQDISLLWRGNQLAEAERLNNRSRLEEKFVQASRSAQNDAQQSEKRIRRLQLAGISFTVLIVVVAILFASWASFQAQDEAREAAAQAEAFYAYQARATAEASYEIAVQAQATAEAAAQRAKAGELAGQALAELDLDANGPKALALVLARESVLTTWQNDGTVTDAAMFALNKSVREASPWLMNLPRRRHTGPVRSVAFSPNGQRIVTASDDTTAIVWNASTGEAILTLTGHINWVNSVAFSPDSQHIVTASVDNTAIVWDATTGAVILTLDGHNASFSPDGQRIVTVRADKTAVVWDAVSGQALLTLSGHTGWVNSAAFSPDGRRIVSTSADKTIRVWNALTGEPLITIFGHTESVVFAAFSPDGKRIVSASVDNTAKIWDADSGTELLTLDGHTSWVNSAVFSSNGQRIVTASSDNTVRVWDAVSGMTLLTITGHTHWVWSAAFSPDGGRIVTASSDQTTKVWDTVTGTQILALSGHSAQIVSAAFSPDGRRILTASRDKTAIVWNAQRGEEILILSGHKEYVNFAAFSPDGLRIVTASSDRTAKIWDATSGTELFTLSGHTAAVRSAVFSPDGSRIVTTSVDQTAKVWDAANGTGLLTLSGHTAAVVYAAFSPDSGRIVTASDDNTAKVWNAADGRKLLTLSGHSAEVLSATFSPDGNRILTASWDHTSKVWSALSGKEVLTLFGHTAAVNSAVFSPNGSHIVTASYDNTAKVWNAASGIEILTLFGHTGGVLFAAFNLNGSRIVTASWDQTAKIWNVAESSKLVTLSGHTAAVMSAAFSPDGNRIVTTSFDDTAKLWSAQSGAELLTLSEHTGPIRSGVFSPDSNYIVSASWDHTAKIWNVTEGAELRTLSGHTAEVLSAVFSPDGNHIVTASADNTAKIWDALNGTELLTLSGHTGSVNSVAFSPDGNRIVTASSDKTAKIWDALNRQNYLRSPVTTMLSTPPSSIQMECSSPPQVPTRPPESGMQPAVQNYSLYPAIPLGSILPHSVQMVLV